MLNDTSKYHDAPVPVRKHNKLVAEVIRLKDAYRVLVHQTTTLTVIVGLLLESSNSVKRSHVTRWLEVCCVKASAKDREIIEQKVQNFLKVLEDA